MSGTATHARHRGAVNPWVIAVAVTIATFMEVLDTSIANVALRYIAGGLSAAESDSEWVITSYLAANASVLLLSGWLSSYFGRRNYYLVSVLIFTVELGGLRASPGRWSSSSSSGSSRGSAGAASSR